MASMRILIIEDDREAASYLVKAFREAGHVADHAADGEDGLAMAMDGPYDVLVVDRMLPKKDGLSVIGELRAAGKATPTPGWRMTRRRAPSSRNRSAPTGSRPRGSITTRAGLAP